MSWSELLAELFFMPAIAFVVGLFMVLMMRKIAAKIQRRVGPPFFQPLYDIVKLYQKDTQVSHGLWHDIGIVMAVGGYIGAEILLPVPGFDGIADKGGIITLSYFLMIPSLGMALGVGQCANPNGSIGISRALTAMLAYDIPFIIVVFGVAWHFQSTSLVEMVEYQQVHQWGIFEMPLLAFAGLFALQGMMGKHPFEIYVAPAEIATGPMVEMSGKYMGGLFVMQSFQFYTAGVLYTSLFLGGGENWITFLIKCFAVIAIPISIAYVFPRFRTEDVVRLLWKWPVMMGLIGLAFVM
ncbi:MAG: NADH-quinone oxidoreductase subunit H [Gammaproteobacteria bacterium]|nr:NADH-quinone oxidoreductase subunit H [Gammaproteobacteria bacterium]